MHYYQHNIKQFNNATRHLTRVERSLYRDAIELYYDQEKPLTSDFLVLSRRLMARTEEEKLALKSVLDEFFHIEGDIFHHDRCDSEIEFYHSNMSAKSRAGKASAAARRKKRDAGKDKIPTPVKHPSNACSTEVQQTSNQEPRTNKQIPPDPPKGDHERFDDFYSAYPRKAGKIQAVKTWNKLKLPDELINRILNDIAQRIACGDFDINDKKHIPHPSTYLNDKRWEDEMIPKGVPHGTYQQSGGERKPSAVDRLRSSAQEREGELNEQIRLAEEEEAHASALGPSGGDLWPSVDQPVWGDDAGDLGPPPDGVLVN